MMGMTNPQEDCPDTDVCANCTTDISDINRYLERARPGDVDTVPRYWRDGFCSKRCAYAYHGKIAVGAIYEV